ncbi:hypothetical protein PI125_g9876 [Phytophthora idaei]|nr:hypothetical protein PI125_g9876 [Phytophthora idaei]KAG3152318.1 hypothetical protein PI126_g10568 [Phytophthora idaei]
MVPTSDTQSYCESVLAQLHGEHSGEQYRGADGPERGGFRIDGGDGGQGARGVGRHDSVTVKSNFGVDDLDAVDGSSSSSTTITATISTTASSTVTSTAWSGPASTASSTAYTVSSNTTQQETGYALSSSNAQAVDATSETETPCSAAGEADDLTVNADASHVSEIAATDNSTGSIASSQYKLLVLV